ncbi:P-loop containing nucleoside triphosphate hydrolase protein [Jackrogersella minutella]|nr:P-loop containing nucleoside triphosphate hydrolase protein [Jackrogersella minutella]
MDTSSNMGSSPDRNEAGIAELDATGGSYILFQNANTPERVVNVSDLRSLLESSVQQIQSSILDSTRYLEGRLNGSERRPETSNNTSEPSVPAGSERATIEELEIRLERAEEERNQLQFDFDALSADLERWKTEFDESQEAREGIESILKDRIRAEQKKSRALFERLQAMKGNIRVMCRIRPASADTPEEELVNFGPRQKGEFSDHWGTMLMPVERRNAMGGTVINTKSFNFERIFGPEESNDDIFNEISDLVECALQGQKVGIFAYGQTGSGKTYTLSHKGPEGGSEDGLIPRTVAMMFESAATSYIYEYSISLSILEIHIDNIYDLQQPIDGEKVQTRIEEAKFLPLDSLETAESMIEEAMKLRVSSSTNKNATSSRSHLILTFRITRENVSQGTVDTGILYLVDLAGSERSAAGGLEGAQLKEGVKINKSLMSLNLVITALGNGTHVAYDTALTKALRPVLSHDSKTLMFVMISPLKKDVVTSVQTLEKGQEATNARLASVNRNDAKRPSSSSNTQSKTTFPARSSGLPTPTTGRFSAPSTPTSRTSTSSTRGNASRRGIPRTTVSRLSVTDIRRPSSAGSSSKQPSSPRQSESEY